MSTYLPSCVNLYHSQVGLVLVSNLDPTQGLIFSVAWQIHHPSTSEPLSLSPSSSLLLTIFNASIKRKLWQSVLTQCPRWLHLSLYFSLGVLFGTCWLCPAVLNHHISDRQTPYATPAQRSIFATLLQLISFLGLRNHYQETGITAAAEQAVYPIYQT